MEGAEATEEGTIGDDTTEGGAGGGGAIGVGKRRKISKSSSVRVASDPDVERSAIGRVSESMVGTGATN